MILIFLPVLLAAAAFLQWRSGRRCLQGLEVALTASATVLEPGEQFDLVVTFRNRGWGFVPFLRYQLQVPDCFEVGLDDSHIHISEYMHRKYVTGTTWLGPRQRLEKRIPVSASKRGYYAIHDLTLHGGDFLGLEEEPRVFTRLCEVVVYPSAAAVPDVTRVLGSFLGDLSVRRFIQEDPVLTLGFREYTGREPMKAISWSQTARRGQLMVKNPDYTVEPSASIILNAESAGGDLQQRLERCYSLARGVCAELERKGIKYDFRTNAALGGMGPAAGFGEGLGPAHYYGILEHLGRASYTARISCRTMLDRSERSVLNGRGIIFITPGGDPEAERCARRFAERSRGTLLILTAKEAGLC